MIRKSRDPHSFLSIRWKSVGVPFNTVLALLENEDNDVVYDKEKDEAALRVALSERLSGRTEDASSKDKLTQMKEKVKTSTEINTEDVGITLRTAKGTAIRFLFQ